MEQILVVEDDKNLNYGLCKVLKTDGRQIVSCFNLKTAREHLLCQTPNLILLDINLPDGSGLSLLKELRKNPIKSQIVLLTANDTDMDIVNGLEQGADDYITKPFSLSVLRARVNTQLRRAKNTEQLLIFKTKTYVFDFNSLSFTINGTPVELSKTEQKLLRLLVENNGRIMERSALIDRIWTDGAEFVDENALSVTIKRLRDKLNANNCIKTVYGIGYMWVNDYDK